MRPVLVTAGPIGAGTHAGDIDAPIRGPITSFLEVHDLALQPVDDLVRGGSVVGGAGDGAHRAPIEDQQHLHDGCLVLVAMRLV